MVPAAKILETARAENVDIVGLSGLITPSLDEMCHVAAEMERQKFDLPLLIGGATTSRVHTAVKIHPNYRRGQAVYVTDASRAVGVASSLMSHNGREPYVAQVRDEYARIAAAHARGEEQKRRLSLADARANALRLDWANYCAADARASSGRRCSTIIRSPSWSTTSTGRRSSRPGSSPASIRDPRRRQGRRGRAQPLRRRLRDARRDHRQALVPRGRPGRVLAGEQRGRRRAGVRRRGARQAARDLAHAAPAAHPARRPRQCGARRLRRPARVARLHRRVHRHRRARRGRDRGALQGRQRRLFIDHDQGAGRPARRGLRRAAARARAPGVLGLCRRRGARPQPI